MNAFYCNTQNFVAPAMQFIQRMEDTSAFRSVDAKLRRNVHPLCTQHDWGTESYWRCYITQNPITLYHPAGTCKMGSRDDPSTVVNAQLRCVFLCVCVCVRVCMHTLEI